MATTDRSTLAGPTRPLGSLEIPQFHLPSAGEQGTYAPRLYGAATIRFHDKKLRADYTRRVAFLVPLEQGVRSVDWDKARPADVMPERLLKDAPAAAPYLPLPAAAMQINSFARWAKNFDRWLARTQRHDLPPREDPADRAVLAPRRGGVSVELVAIVWELA